jgi:hypothetical protein
MKRYFAAALWFYSFWYLGSMIAGLVGVPDLIGPVLGTAAGVIVGVDPRGLIWSRPTATAATSTATATAANAA